jgi:site-specific recombinase XerD
MPLAGTFSIRPIILANGGRFAALIRKETGFPVVLVARYIATSVLGLERENTTISRLKAIKALYEWGLSLPCAPFDPEVRLLEPDAFDLESIRSFALYLRARRRHHVAIAPQTAWQPNGGREVVDNHTVAQNLMYGGAFVVWAAETQARPKLSEARVSGLRKAFAREVKAYQKTRSPSPKGLSEAQQQRLRDICRPESLENPFNKPVRYRNQAMVNLLLDAPLRRGELAGIRLQDMKVTGADKFSVTIVVQDETTPSTKLDPRRERPRQKTLGREIPISQNSKSCLLAYLQRERPKQSRSPFVFLESRCGQPLSLGGVNNVFGRIKEAFEAEFPELFPHLTRHTVNYNLKLHNMNKGWPDHKVKQVQNYLNGWTDTSEQGATYGAAANVILANEYVSEMHKKLSGGAPQS